MIKLSTRDHNEELDIAAGDTDRFSDLESTDTPTINQKSMVEGGNKCKERY